MGQRLFEIDVVYGLDFETSIDHARFTIATKTIEQAIKKSKQALIEYLSKKYRMKYNINGVMLSRDFIKKHLDIIAYDEYENDFNTFLNEYHD